MDIKNLFDTIAYNDIVNRLNNLQPESQRQWGKMSVAQMMAHCKEAFKVPLSEMPMPRMLLGRLVGGMIKYKLYNNTPWQQGLPTAPNFVIKNEREFEIEKNGLLELVTRFYTAGPQGAGKYPHPFFGTLTPEQWGKSMWKHLDHHLRQFNC